MKKIILSMAVVVSTAAQAVANEDIVVYDQGKLQGQSLPIGASLDNNELISSHLEMINSDGFNLNDRISSLTIPDDTCALVTEHANFGGWWQVIEPGFTRFSGREYLNDNISTILRYPKNPEIEDCAIEKNLAVFYENPYLSGYKLPLVSWLATDSENTYNSQLSSVSSVKVPKCMEITISKMDGSTINLGPGIHNLSFYGFNDAVYAASSKFKTNCANAQLGMTGSAGGVGGEPFSDYGEVDDAAHIRNVYIRSGARVDALGFGYTNGQLTMHGGTGGTLKTYHLLPDEKVSNLIVCSGSHNDTITVFYARFTTTMGNRIEGGNPTTDCTFFVIRLPKDKRITGLHGRSGNIVNRVGLLFGD